MNQLKVIRAGKRLSQFQLGLMTGLLQSRLSLIENDLILPQSEEKQKIGKALGVRPEEIWGQENQEEGR